MVLDEFRHLPEYGGLPELPGESLGLSGREEKEARWRATPQAQFELGGGPLSFLLLPLPSFPSETRKGEISTPTTRRTPPPLAPLERASRPPPPSFIYVGRGHPRTHKLIV